MLGTLQKSESRDCRTSGSVSPLGGTDSNTALLNSPSSRHIRRRYTSVLAARSVVYHLGACFLFRSPTDTDLGSSLPAFRLFNKLERHIPITTVCDHILIAAAAPHYNIAVLVDILHRSRISELFINVEVRSNSTLTHNGAARIQPFRLRSQWG